MLMDTEENKTFNIYNQQWLGEVLSECSDHGRKRRFVLSTQEWFDKRLDSTEAYFVVEAIKNFYKYVENKQLVVEWHREENLILVGVIAMSTNKLTFSFPYENYDQYYDIFVEINELVSEDGIFVIFANNIPYALEAGVCIETYGDTQAILALAKANNWERVYSFGIKELIEGTSGRQYNALSVCINQTKESLTNKLETIFLLSPKTAYEDNGFHCTINRKKKLFVSYCHKDKETVRKIIDTLRLQGLDFWLDEEQIDLGDRILERVNQGMKESDIPILFISEHTKTSVFAKHELESFFSQVIYQKNLEKAWIIVRLDQTDPNDILLGLGNFKYFTYTAGKDMNLAELIKKKFNGLNERQNQ